MAWLALIPALYLLVILAMYLVQDWLVFPGRRSRGRVAIELTSEFAEVRFPVPGSGLAYGVFRAVPEARGTALLLLGNAEYVARALGSLEYLAQLRIQTLAVDYPGFGGSEGQPSSAAILACAEAAMAHLQARRDVDPEHLWLIGRSLGTGPALHLAGRTKVRGVVLLAPFTSLRATGALHFPYFPVRWLMRAEFDNASAITRVTAPILITHSRDDQVVPFVMAEHLARLARAPVVRCWRDYGGHDLDFPAELDRFFAR